MSKKQAKVLKKGLISIAILVGAGLLFYQSAVRLDIVSDEEMIARFNENRTEIEELVRRYRFYEPPEGASHYEGFMAQEGTVEMMERIGIYNIQYIMPDWYSNPYSQEEAQKRWANTLAGKGDGLMGSVRYGTTRIDFSPLNKFTAMKPLYGMVWKDLIYIPEIPKIENGVLFKPISDTGKYLGYVPLVPSLNQIPPQWKMLSDPYKKDACVYRQLDTHWYLSLCRGG